MSDSRGEGERMSTMSADGEPEPVHLDKPPHRTTSRTDVTAVRRGSMMSVVSELSATNRPLRDLSDSWHSDNFGIGPSMNALDVSRHSHYTLRSHHTVASHGVRSFLGARQDSIALRKKPWIAWAFKRLGITKEGLNPFLCICIVINCISIGYLSLPWAFANAGTVLATLGFALVMGQSYITAVYTLETCARAEALSNLVPTAAQASTRCLALSQVLPAATLANAILKDESLCSPGNTDEKWAKKDDVAENGLPADNETYEDSATKLKGDSSREWGDEDFLEEFIHPLPSFVKGSELLAGKPIVEKIQVQTTSIGAFSCSNCTEDASRGSATLMPSSLKPSSSESTHFENNAGREVTPSQTIKENVQEESANNDALHRIEGNKFELSDLCRIFLGRRVCYFFFATIAFDLYGITWTFATVFASGLSDKFTIMDNEDTNYKIFILVFAAIVVPVTCMDLHDQVLVQMIFLMARMVMVLIMLSTTAEAWASGAARFGDQIAAEQDVPVFTAQLLYIAVQIAIFSTAYQFVGPGIADVSANKSATRAILGSSCLYIFLSTLILSIVLALYFGPKNIETSSNLNWGAYHGGTGEIGPEGERIDIAMWARMISGYVVAFPAFDALAIYPLLCLSLGEIFVGAWFKNSATYEKISWKKRTAFRLVGCVPQLVGAAFVSDIGVIANYAGLFTVLSYSVCPCLLAVYSRRAMQEVSLPPATYYQTMFSTERWEWTICISASAFIVYVIVMTAVVESRQPY